jgi:hypothetical protein
VNFFRNAICATLLLTALAAPAKAADASGGGRSNGQSNSIVFEPGLICDTQDQAERFVALLGDNVESALSIVNSEAGTPNACLVATTGFIRGGTVSEVLRNGLVVDVVEVTVMAVATELGLQAIEPKKYFSIVRTGDRMA